jgi:hypothetical protein
MLNMKMNSNPTQVSGNEAFGDAGSSLTGFLAADQQKCVLAGIEKLLKIQLHRISIEDNSQSTGWDIDQGV